MAPKQNGSGTKYYADNASVTDHKFKAARFYSPEDAKDFAKRLAKQLPAESPLLFLFLSNQVQI